MWFCEKYVSINLHKGMLLLGNLFLKDFSEYTIILSIAKNYGSFEYKTDLLWFPILEFGDLASDKNIWHE